MGTSRQEREEGRRKTAKAPNREDGPVVYGYDYVYVERAVGVMRLDAERMAPALRRPGSTNSLGYGGQAACGEAALPFGPD